MAGAKKFNLTELLNQRVQQSEQEEERREEAEEKGTGIGMVIDINDLIPAKENFYSIEDVEDLKQSIELVGILQPLLVMKDTNGKFKIIAGHRRHKAVMQLLEEGKERFRYVPVVVKKKEEQIIDKLALIMANRFREKTDWEKMQETLETEKLILELKEKVEITGRTRDLLAEILETSPAQIGRYKAIYNNVIPEIMAEFKADRIGISVAYEAAGLPEDYQKQAAELFRENGILTLLDIKQLKKLYREEQQILEQMDISQLQQGEEEEEPEEVTEEQEEPEEFDPQPETVVSLCYSCQNYESCHEKKATVSKCNDYINRREATKTEEERYTEEQETIDRETRRKLREQQEEEKMQQLPSDVETKERIIKVAKEKYEEIRKGNLTFLLLERDDFRIGEELTLKEYAAGEETGRNLVADIAYIWEDWTGLEEDYCIIGFKINWYR